MDQATSERQVVLQEWEVSAWPGASVAGTTRSVRLHTASRYSALVLGRAILGCQEVTARLAIAHELGVAFRKLQEDLARLDGLRDTDMPGHPGRQG